MSVEIKAVEIPKVSGILAEFAQASDFGACMIPLLSALNWRGDMRHVAESLPHFVETLDLTGFRNMMAHLNYRSEDIRMPIDKVDDRLYPFLYIPDKQGAMVVFGRNEDGSLDIFDGSSGERFNLTDFKVKGRAFFFQPMDVEEVQQTQSRIGWFRMVMERFRTFFYYILGITFVITLLQVVTPLYVMQVYDRVVGSGSMSTLAFLVGGALAALGFDWGFRRMRAVMLGYVGARLDNIIGNAVFQRILYLLPAYTERATIGSQVARIRDFESIREFFTGALVVVFLELPFTVVFLLVIASLAGPLAFVPMVTMILFVILWVTMTPLVSNSGATARRFSSQKQSFIVEALNSMRAIKYCRAEDIWLDRFREMSAKAAQANFKTSFINAIVQSLGSAFIVLSGLGTIGWGVLRVLSGDMTVGGLVACMVLVWRVLTPMQALFTAMTRLEAIRASVAQVNNLMNVKPEREPHAPIKKIAQFRGDVTFSRVSIRYSQEADPALVGVTFEAKAGECIVVIGGNGSGKSTLVKLIAGIYSPQAGGIFIDGRDTRQLDPIELRQAIAYVPQTVNLFHGTIAQNLRLAHPTASQEELEDACSKATVLEEILALPKGWWTRIGDSRSSQLSSGFIQKLSLARAYLKKAPVILFDEPANALDWDADDAFQNVVKELKGKSTIFIVTHSPRHRKLADQLLYLERGYLQLAGPAEEVEARLPKGLI
ncbi:ABC transporter related protein [Magnetococcus marinus MC-1]|uniref:ABC transporter related protein n=1 Tax=Magnetococcus marinus (strain ATCC BAA-1437 / JCM 17883 / MC-1) TaxID=156889 RepID=A0L5K9_MAGMM|nr:ATP-binding cassette domain-containing protein [Magnetococcus marinus]ABK43252.1 ABC transporter related protein [Magnetococcus marinus MC-1]